MFNGVLFALSGNTIYIIVFQSFTPPLLGILHGVHLFNNFIF